MPPASSAPVGRLLVAGPVLGAVLTVALGVLGAAASPGPVLAAAPAARAAVAEAPATHGPVPSITPSAAPTSLAPSPAAPRPTPSATGTRRPTAAPTRTRTRVRTASPRPRVTQAPTARATTSRPLPTVTSGLGSIAPVQVPPATGDEPSPARVASSSSSAGNDLSRLFQLALAAGALLGAGGALGLYVTRG